MYRQMVLFAKKRRAVIKRRTGEAASVRASAADSACAAATRCGA
jgi:hypothetical protein